jgi:hypothetical protein
VAETTRRARRQVTVLAAFETETDRPFRVGDRLRLSELGDPELAVASTGVADETGDMVMLARPDRVPGVVHERPGQG